MKSPTTLLLASMAALTLHAGCGGGGAAPPPTAVPSAGLAGRTVVVFPTQRVIDVPGDPDAELAFALRTRGGAGRWVLPEALRAQLARSPGLDVPLDGLPIDVFFRSEVRRVGDPLYGIVRRAAAMSDATAVLIPLGVTWRAETPEAGSAVEVTAAVLDVLTGRVVWFGVLEGAAATPEDPAGLVQAMERLAAALLPTG